MYFKEFFKFLLTILILFSLSIPIVSAIRFPGNHWEIFADTWLFILYAIIIYVVGSASISSIWGRG